MSDHEMTYYTSDVKVRLVDDSAFEGGAIVFAKAVVAGCLSSRPVGVFHRCLPTVRFVPMVFRKTNDSLGAY
jgi:hypothetical protein